MRADRSLLKAARRLGLLRPNCEAANQDDPFTLPRCPPGKLDVFFPRRNLWEKGCASGAIALSNAHMSC